MMRTSENMAMRIMGLPKSDIKETIMGVCLLVSVS